MSDLLASSPGRPLLHFALMCATLKRWEWPGDEASLLQQGNNAKIIVKIMQTITQLIIIAVRVLRVYTTQKYH